MFGNLTINMYLIAGSVALLIGLLSFLAAFYLKNKAKANDYDKQLEDIVDHNINKEEKPTIAQRWNHYWAKKFGNLSWKRYSHKESQLGRDIFVFILVVALIVTVVFRNPLIGLLVPIVLVFLLSFSSRFVDTKNTEDLTNQLPGFLFSLKANIQAHEIPETALLKIIKTTPSPLRDELDVLENLLLANTPFTEAMKTLQDTTTSPELKFLCACIIQASGTGANLENQITTVQDILESRRKVANELTKATKSASTSIWAATVIIPAGFIGTYLLSQQYRDFWFKVPFSIPIFIVAVLLYFAALFGVRHQVSKIKNI